MHGDVTVIPLNYLEGSWGRLPANAAAMAYLEDNSASPYPIEQWGMPRVIDLLNALKAKASVATALQNKLFVSYKQFHRQRLDSFEQKRT